MFSVNAQEQLDQNVVIVEYALPGSLSFVKAKAVEITKEVIERGFVYVAVV